MARMKFWRIRLPDADHGYAPFAATNRREARQVLRRLLGGQRLPKGADVEETFVM